MISFQSYADASKIVGKICKATASSIFGYDHKLIELDNVVDDVAYVHYINARDKSRRAIKCRLDRDRVVWASDNSAYLKRWRTSPQDDIVLYSIVKNNLTISQEEVDGSISHDVYKLSGL
ncbi:hypothetical protein [Enterobacter roggenkampii]|uniref:hypothetical protein n=1 Tax=Enterobacter roggenkampii TaxID=1812935 RepID=UPI0013F4E452|nr:hypothetical protein [Enterobacter roggenkampii]